MIKTQTIEYHDADVILEGFYAYDDSITEKRPAVLVAPDWSGKNKLPATRQKNLQNSATQDLPSTCMAKGKTGKTKEEKNSLDDTLDGKPCKFAKTYSRCI